MPETANLKVRAITFAKSASSSRANKLKSHFDSRRQTFVSANAKRATPPQQTITTLSPHRSAAGANILAPTNAPNFPAAALIPFRVERHSSEYVTDGSRNVVVFGP